MSRWIVTLLALFVAAPAWAQFPQPTYVLPAATRAYGVLALTTSTVALTTATMSGNSPALAIPPTSTFTVGNYAASAGNVVVCPLGEATCSSAMGGIEVPKGLSVTLTVTKPTVSPTIAAISTATVWVSAQ